MSVRVIAGTHKNRVLRVPAGLATRPTGAKVREAVFSILGDIEGTRVLDLYAGSGALGIEALSRGAASAVFVDNDRAAADAIRHNLRSLGLDDRGRVLPLTIEAALRRLSAEPGFDLVFVDPPWATLDRVPKALLGLPQLLSETACVVVEHRQGAPPQLEGLVAYDQRAWGDTGVVFFQRPSAQF